MADTVTGRTDVACSKVADLQIAYIIVMVTKERSNQLNYVPTVVRLEPGRNLLSQDGANPV
jgi:hypothetical protein